MISESDLELDVDVSPVQSRFQVPDRNAATGCADDDKVWMVEDVEGFHAELSVGFPVGCQVESRVFAQVEVEVSFRGCTHPRPSTPETAAN